MAKTATKRRPRRRAASSAAPRGVRYWDTDRGQWMIRERASGRAVPAYSPEGERDRAPGRFDPRRALSRAGLATDTAASRTAEAGRSLGRRVYRQEIEAPAATTGELLVFTAASLLGLALLDAALTGRGPVAVERLLGFAGRGIRALLDPYNPIVQKGEGTPFVERDYTRFGDVGPRPEEGTRGGGGIGTRAGGDHPTGGKGKIIGTPGAGTHSPTEGPANWQSDNAVDIAVPKGTPVYATRAGVISSSLGFGPMGPPSSRFGGSRLHLESYDGPTFFYAHLDRIVVKRGQAVRRGQLLGYSGVANGVAHLHFAVDEGSPFAWLERAARAVQRAIGI